MEIFYNELDETGKKVPVVLNDEEQGLADYVQAEYERMHGPRLRKTWKNALQSTSGIGFERLITTLTTVVKKITEQKFYTEAPADAVPIVVGNGAFNTNLLTYQSVDMSGDFAQGIVNLATDNTRLASVDAGVTSTSVVIKSWAKSLSYNIIQMEEAARSGSWDIVVAKEKSRKRNWDLGIQRTAFLGLQGDSSCLGLLNQLGITNNTTLLATSIWKLAQTPNNLSLFLGQLLNVYQINNNATAMPNRLIMPMSDYLGCATSSSPNFPIKSVLEYMEEVLKKSTGNADFKIIGSRYCEGAFGGGSNQTYVLMNHSEDSIRMDIPVDYTSTMANSLNNFSFQNAGYGQFTGVQTYRPLELLYLSFPSSQA